MEENNQTDQQKNNKGLINRLKAASNFTEKTVKRTKTAIKVTLAALTLGAAGYVYKQLNRSPEEVREDAKVVREEKIPQKYPNSPVRSGSAKVGSKIGEWLLTVGRGKNKD